MANWMGVQQGLKEGYVMGKDAGGKLSGLGMALSKIADRLKQERETGEAMDMKRNLLGMEESSKIRIAEKEAELAGWKPKTQEEAIEYAKAKQHGGMIDVGTIDPVTGEINTTGQVPYGSKYYKGTISSDQDAYIKAEQDKARAKAKVFTPSENERSFMAEFPQAKKDLEGIIEQLTPKTKAPLGGFARISSRQRWLVPEQGLRKLQEPYTRVLKNLLFGPAGKALTGTEREVLEMAASPTGKSSEEWERDIIAAYDTLNKKYDILSSGILPDNEQKTMPMEDAQSDIFTVRGIDGNEIQVSRQEAIRRGYINGK